MEFVIVLRLVGRSNFIFISSHSGERTLLKCRFIPPSKSMLACIGSYLDIYRLISFKCIMVKETAEVYSLIPVWMTLTLIENSKPSIFIFSQISPLILMTCSILPQPVCLLKIMVNLFAENWITVL